MRKIILNRQLLYKKYIVEKKTSYKIAEELGCSRNTILRNLKKYNIEIRNANCALYFSRREASEETRQKRSKSLKGRISPMKGRKLSKEHKEKISKALVGSNGPNWNGGKSFEPYCLLFNFTLKEEIRNRDNRVCQLCGKSEILNGKRLAVHHIDGDKMQGCNGKKWQLVALCNSCNSKRDTIEKEFLLISNMGRFG